MPIVFMTGLDEEFDRVISPEIGGNDYVIKPFSMRELVARYYIIKNVWGFSYIGKSRTVDEHVRWLRERIEKDPSRPMRVITVRGGGDRFDGSIQEIIMNQ